MCTSTDHHAGLQNAAKVGVGVMIESPSMTPEEMGMMQMPVPPAP